MSATKPGARGEALGVGAALNAIECAMHRHADQPLHVDAMSLIREWRGILENLPTPPAAPPAPVVSEAMVDRIITDAGNPVWLIPCAACGGNGVDGELTPDGSGYSTTCDACGGSGCDTPRMDQLRSLVRAALARPARGAGTDVFDDARAERVRAHRKHGDRSMESQSADSPRRLAILVEEVGEVAKEFNEADSGDRPVDRARLRKELIQVTAMAGAWADVCRDAAALARPAETEDKS